MPIGHAKTILNAASNKAQLSIAPELRTRTLRELGRLIEREWNAGTGWLDNMTDIWGENPTPEEIKLSHEMASSYRRSAVSTYRAALLKGFRAEELDQALQAHSMDNKMFQELKAAIPKLTSAEFPLNDLIDERSIKNNLDTLAERNRVRVTSTSSNSVSVESEKLIVKAEVKAIQAAGIGVSEAEAASSVRSLLSLIKNAKALAVGGVQVAIADFIVQNAVGALHDLIVKDPSQAESLARLIEENKQAGVNKNLNNVVEY